MGAIFWRKDGHPVKFPGKLIGLTMKRMLLVLVPWMAMVAAAQTGRPASVVFTHFGTFDQGFERVGNDVLADVRAVEQWGWRVRTSDDEATIEADGRRLRVPLIDHKKVSVRACGSQLGANMEWIDGTDTLVFSAAVRSIQLKGNILSIDTSLDCWPQVSRLNSPDRLVIDLEGASYSDQAKYEFQVPDAVRVAQYRRTTFRIVIESPGITNKPLLLLNPGRTFEIDLARLGVKTDHTVRLTSSQPAKDKPDHGSYNGASDGFPMGEKPPVKSTPKADPPKTEPKTEPNLNPTTPKVEPNPGVAQPPVADAPVVGKPRPVVQNRGDLMLVFPLSKRLNNPASSRYADPTTIDVLIPASKPEVTGILDKIADLAPSVQLMDDGSGNTRLQIRTARPVGVRVSSTANELQILLIKPKIDGSTIANKTIVVDAGHGGTDSGATSPGGDTYEKNITLKIARYVADELSSQGAQAVMTRNDDIKIPLPERSAIANRLGADLFVSIHINSNKVDNSKSGIMIFHHNQDPLGILLAECISKEVAKVSELPALGVVSDTRIYQSGFAVLRNSTMPCVLCELGFINHAKDRARMRTEDFQVAVAKAIVKGIKVFLGDAQPNKKP